MTHRERFLGALNRELVDRLPYGDGLWGETRQKYIDEGKVGADEDLCRHFDMSWRSGGGIQPVADMDFEERIIDETEETKLVLSGNGAQLRWWKNKSGTPEHVDFAVKERSAWETLIKPHLLDVDRRRIPFDKYRETKTLAAAEERAFTWNGLAPFEQMHPVCGHEHMLVGMALDPDWVRDMVMTFADFTIMHLETLFAEEGKPDAMWFFEDMGFKERPFMSPAMYEEILMPGHRRLFDYSHSIGSKVIVHSCGYVEPLVPGLVNAGMDCLQAMEVKAGMDLRNLLKDFGDRLSFCGNLDIRIVAGNDRRSIDEELARKILPVLDAGSGFIVHSDHSIPPEVEHDTLEYFFQRGSRVVEWGREHPPQDR